MNHTTALAVSLAIAMSSTAIVMQTLKEKNITKSSGGMSSFFVLLFQDVMVIPILALLPLLAPVQTEVTENKSQSLLDAYPAWLQTIFIIGSIALLLLSGRFLFVPLLRVIARTKLRELFTATSLLLVIGVSLLMQIVGLSPALGAFIAGVVLANSEYRHELESDLEPFKGLLLGLFFIGVGATINIDLILTETQTIIGLVLLLMIIKSGVLLITGKVFSLKKDQNILFGLILSQVGEFSFVIYAFSRQLHILDQRWFDILMSVTALSMLITPLLLLFNDLVLIPYTGVKEKEDDQKADEIESHHDVIIAGFGHFGSTIGRFLRANRIYATILDNDSDRVELLRKMGFEVYYGDATRLDLLEAAGAARAKILIAAIDDISTNQRLIKTVKKHFPHLQVLARARNRMDAYELLEMGVKNIYRETLFTSIYLAIDVLKAKGVRAYTATRKGLDFIRYDEQALHKLARHRKDMKTYVFNVREQIELQERLLSADLHANLKEADHAWDSEEMRGHKKT
jgi:CPA2 family monovalent cation:H+ antiporter-2